MNACDCAPLRGCCSALRATRAASAAALHHRRAPPRQLAQGLRCATPRRATHTGRTSGAAVRARTDGGGDAATVIDASTAASPAPGAPAFDWLHAWYAVGMVDAFAPDAPTALRVVGVPLALWRDASGEWHAVRNECPHRLAPLSEGRIAEDGTLQVRARPAQAVRQLEETCIAQAVVAYG